jgi:hypothetical protein
MLGYFYLIISDFFKLIIENKIDNKKWKIDLLQIAQ